MKKYGERIFYFNLMLKDVIDTKSIFLFLSIEYNINELILNNFFLSCPNSFDVVKIIYEKLLDTTGNVK